MQIQTIFLLSSTKSNIFQFKQFAVDQTGCGMKINTDGVLLGALVQAENPSSILDIGTGTGVVALMLAQRFPDAQVGAIEIDNKAALTAQNNFNTSQFTKRLKCYQQSFQDFSKQYPNKKYDLIVSNPPFFTNSLKNSDDQKQLARHASNDLFKELISFARQHLTPKGFCYLILPLEAARQIIEPAFKYGMKLQSVISIKSSASKAAHRQIITVGFGNIEKYEEEFIIYQSEKVYSDQYQNVLKDFLTIF